MIVLSAAFGLLSGCASGVPKVDSDIANKPLKAIAPYPEAKEGYTRNVIYLPALANEEKAKVELIMGKTMFVDCNQHTLGGKLTSKVLQGWGYDYLELTNVTPPISTMMACPGPNTEKFVTIHSEQMLQRYNSLLPIVVYAPSDIQVKYRIWAGSDLVQDAIIK